MYQQKWCGFVALITLSTLYCAPGMANMQTWTFDKSTQSFEKNKNNKTKTVTARIGDTSAGKIKTAKMAWASDSALGIRNKDETTKGNTWSQVLGSGTGDAFVTLGNYSNVDLSYYAVNPTTVTSTKWLIGVYNPVFGAGGDGGNDGFRLASIHTSIINELDAIDGPVSNVNEVPVPGPLALMVAGLHWIPSRRTALARCSGEIAQVLVFDTTAALRTLDNSYSSKGATQ
jgi:hypothetical protein